MNPSSLELNFNNSGDVLIHRVRQLAKSTHWQTLYSHAKELHFSLFANNVAFSELQILFLNYLGFYSALNMDIAMGDITDLVLEDEIYEDAYMYYKQKVDKKKVSERGLNKQPHQDTQVPQSTQWVFKKPEKA